MTRGKHPNTIKALEENRQPFAKGNKEWQKRNKPMQYPHRISLRVSEEQLNNIKNFCWRAGYYYTCGNKNNYR